jgi:ankyrin repeat protein
MYFKGENMSTNSFSADQLREFVIAGHWNLPKVKELLAQFPEILNVPYQWGENDYETAIQGAAHVGSIPIAEFLLEQGAPLEICTAAMLGRTEQVALFLDETPGLINARGAHGIPLMAHAVLSGNVALASMLLKRGAREGISMALGNAVSKGHIEMTKWLLDHSTPDLSWTNYEGKTPLVIASEAGNDAIVTLLLEHGALS